MEYLFFCHCSCLLDLFQRENGRSAYKCPLCSTTSNGSKVIQHHIAVVHGGKKEYTCEICQKQFAFLPNKKRHLKLGSCPGKTKVKPLKEVIEDIKNIQPVVKMNPIKIPKKVCKSIWIKLFASQIIILFYL